MSATGERVFAVVGATGQQGGATVDALLTAGARVRALTRDPSSDGARSLAQRGVEVVPADAGDPASLRAAFAGVDGAFVMTTPFGPGGTERETE
ncbi:MAG: NmrA family NAD(P)-binding protein, partial [Friedmanniella sp.]